MAVYPHYAAVFWTELYFGNISREKYTYKLHDFGNLDFKIWSWLKRGGITRMHGIVHLMAEILLAREADCINTFPRYNIFLWKWQVDSFAPIICRRIIWYWCAVISVFIWCREPAHFTGYCYKFPGYEFSKGSGELSVRRRRPSYVVNFFKNLLLWKYLTNGNQTWSESLLGCLVSKLCPVMPCTNQHGRCY
jgi:hypothetical protein